MHLPPLSVGVFRFYMTVTDEIILPPYKGFAFRGVFGTVLKELACVIPGEKCSQCPFKHTCTYAYLFETSPEEGKEGFRRFSNFPRPYIINPPMGDKRQFKRYDTLSFEFVLTGRGNDYIQPIICTFEEIGRRGIRNNMGKFMIDRVTCVNDAGKEQLMYTKGKINSEMPPLRTISLQQDEHTGTTGATLLFHTPLLLEERGQIHYKPPQFDFLFEHLARRIMLLQALHGPGGLLIEQMDKLLVYAKCIELTETDMQWKSMERISNRQQNRIKTGGLIGCITYRGELAPFIPFLRAGELIHIGKSTTFGFGGYRLRIE